MSIILRNYQQPFYNQIQEAMIKNNRICAVLPTGGGKSVVIAKLARGLSGRTLILTHRIEILQQNAEWFKNASVLTAKENGLRYDSKIVIAMVQTLHARLEKYGMDYIGKIDNIILDEIQVLIFEKVFERYNFKKLIGFTGTPVLDKKIYTTVDGIDFVEPYTLSEMYDILVQGPDSQELIDLGYLTQDYNIVLDLPNFDKLKESKSNPDGYTSNSMNEVYLNSASLEILSESYQKYCKGKKTLIFNSSTKINKFVYDHFKSLGCNVKLFDTVNKTDINSETGKKYTRDEIIKWFNKERDAILINTNVFTTGFNVPDVEVVIVNRATKSLSLWIQMVGRGSRITDKIFKDKFTVIDLGQNIHEHGRWSEKRDWNNWFYSPGPKRRNVMDMTDTWDCKKCGSLNVKGDIICSVCGEKKKDIVYGEKREFKEGELIELEPISPPKAKSIIEYVSKIDENTDFAFQLLDKRILEMFNHHNITKEFYFARVNRFRKRVEDIYRPIYFAILNSDLKQGARKRLETMYERIINKIEKQWK